MADFPETRASLLLRLRDARDEAAWRQFIDLYAPLVYGYLRKQGLQDAGRRAGRLRHVLQGPDHGPERARKHPLRQTVA